MSGAADKPGLRGDRGSTFARGRAAASLAMPPEKVAPT